MFTQDINIRVVFEITHLKSQPHMSGVNVLHARVIQINKKVYWRLFSESKLSDSLNCWGWGEIYVCRPVPVAGGRQGEWTTDRKMPFRNLAPVPLTIFRSNSKFDQNLQWSGLKCNLPITTKLCTRDDSYTVVTCAKFCCDRFSIFWIRALQILVEFRIRSKYC